MYPKTTFVQFLHWLWIIFFIRLWKPVTAQICVIQKKKELKSDFYHFEMLKYRISGPWNLLFMFLVTPTRFFNRFHNRFLKSLVMSVVHLSPSCFLWKNQLIFSKWVQTHFFTDAESKFEKRCLCNRNLNPLQKAILKSVQNFSSYNNEKTQKMMLRYKLTFFLDFQW